MTTSPKTDTQARRRPCLWLSHLRQRRGGGQDDRGAHVGRHDIKHVVRLVAREGRHACHPGGTAVSQSSALHTLLAKCRPCWHCSSRPNNRYQDPGDEGNTSTKRVQVLAL